MSREEEWLFQDTLGGLWPISREAWSIDSDKRRIIYIGDCKTSYKEMAKPCYIPQRVGESEVKWEDLPPDQQKLYRKPSYIS